MRTLHKLFCFAVVGVCTFAACRSHAQAEVDWDSINGFQPSSFAINAGDTVYFLNMDSLNYVELIGDPPESFDVFLNVGDPPYAHVYNNPGTFTVADGYAI